jgi:hypothetical protein
VMFRVLHQAPDLDGCPPQLRPLLERCLDKDPAGRPSPAGIIEACRAMLPDDPAGFPQSWLPDTGDARQETASPGGSPPGLPALAADPSVLAVDPSALAVDSSALAADPSVLVADPPALAASSQAAGTAPRAKAESTAGRPRPQSRRHAAQGRRRRRIITRACVAVVLIVAGGTWALLHSTTLLRSAPAAEKTTPRAIPASSTAAPRHATASPRATSVHRAASPSPSPRATIEAAPPSKPTATVKPVPTVSLPEPVSMWLLNDDTGTTAVDSMGVNTATGSNIGWCSGNGNCATFNGTSSAFTTSGPVISTAPGSSFTVSANVYMTAFPPSGASETIVSQDGTDDSGFYLQYSGGPNRWAFSRVTTNSDDSPPGIRALSKSAPSLYTWTNLVGVFNASNNQLSLYVNGVLEGTATDTTPFAATGVLAIGRAQFDGESTDWFNGAANDVQVFDVALTADQVKKLSGS